VQLNPGLFTEDKILKGTPHLASRSQFELFQRDQSGLLCRICSPFGNGSSRSADRKKMVNNVSQLVSHASSSLPGTSAFIILLMLTSTRNEASIFVPLYK
jgi:hypothetical protein